MRLLLVDSEQGPAGKGRIETLVTGECGDRGSPLCSPGGLDCHATHVRSCIACSSRQSAHSFGKIRQRSAFISQTDRQNDGFVYLSLSRLEGPGWLNCPPPDERRLASSSTRSPAPSLTSQHAAATKHAATLAPACSCLVPRATDGHQPKDRTDQGAPRTDLGTDEEVRRCFGSS